MKERDCKNTSLHYRKPFPDLPLIAVQSSLIMHCQGQSSKRDLNGRYQTLLTRDLYFTIELMNNYGNSECNPIIAYPTVEI